MSVGEGDSHLQEAAHSWGQARGRLGQGGVGHQMDTSQSLPTASLTLHFILTQALTTAEQVAWSRR